VKGGKGLGMSAYEWIPEHLKDKVTKILNGFEKHKRKSRTQTREDFGGDYLAGKRPDNIWEGKKEGEACHCKRGRGLAAVVETEKGQRRVYTTGFHEID